MKNFKKLLALVLAVCILSPLAASAHPFEDVPAGVWYDPYVEYVYENGLMNGTGTADFGPALTMNRAMVVTVLYRMAGSPEVSTTAPFTDVQKGSFYEKPVAWAYENGIVMGMSATEFAPGADVLRCQLVTFFYRFAKAMGHDTSARTDLTVFRDHGQIMPFAAEAFSWAVAEGVISGMSADTLGPNGTANRAQCAVILFRIDRLLKGESGSWLVLKDFTEPLQAGTSCRAEYYYVGSGTLTWKSSNAAVATVDQNGVVTACGAGTAYITVRDGDKSAACKVNVNDKRESKITIVEPEIMIMVGDTYQLTVLTEGTVGPLTWMSLDENVATVNQNGVITALSEGYCYVYVTDGNTEAVCNFRIEKKMAKAEEIRIGYTDGPFYDGVTRYKGDYVVVTAINKPNEAVRDIIAKSSNPNVVRVSATKVNGNSRDITLNFKSAGTATITLTSGDRVVSQSYTITVKEDYDFNPGNRQLTPEEFADYTTRVMCANGFIYSTGATSWRQLTLTKAELNFDEAVEHAYNYIHSWWPNGCRACQIVYIGQNEDGDYVFHTCWG